MIILSRPPAPGSGTGGIAESFYQLELVVVPNIDDDWLFIVEI